jgi:hypothetical protein
LAFNHYRSSIAFSKGSPANRQVHIAQRAQSTPDFVDREFIQSTAEDIFRKNA